MKGVASRDPGTWPFPPRPRLGREPPRKARGARREDLSRRHAQHHRRGDHGEPRRPLRRPHRHARRPGARPYGGGPGGHRRARLVGSRRSRRGRRRGGRARPPARALRARSRRAALRALVEDLREAHGDHLHPALALGARPRAHLDRRPDPPHRPGCTAPDRPRRGRDVRGVLRHSGARRADLPEHVQRRGGLQERLHLPPRPRQDLLLPSRRPGLPDVPPQGRAPGHSQRRPVGADGPAGAPHSRAVALRDGRVLPGAWLPGGAGEPRRCGRRRAGGGTVTFRRIPGGATDPLRVVVAGAGGMGRAWLAAIRTSPDVVVAGLADVDVARARQVADELAGPGVPVGADAVELAWATGAQALVDVTTPDAHHPVTTAALFAGLPVLGEKPVAASLAQALSLAAAAEVSGELFMVSQSRRWNPHVFALRDLAASLGTVALATTQFFRASHFPGFREEMSDPLLVDMAIHPFDTARFVLASEPVSVYCEAFNPAWSWFAGSAASSATFTFSSGARYVYTGSWCAPGVQTSWNGEWRVSAHEGSLTWDGESAPVLDRSDATPVPGPSMPAAQPGIVWALHEFV